MTNPKCTECGQAAPTLRRPANFRQAIWGGWTCPHCGVEFDRFGRTVTPSGPAFASDPGGLTVSPARLRVLRPDLFGVAGLIGRIKVRVGLDWDQREYLDGHLRDGDGRAAVVVSTDPLLVAAYTDELDAVAILEFPDEFVEAHALRDGSRLLTVNTYTLHDESDADVVPGPKTTGRWNGFNPIIAEFVSDDAEQIARIKSAISADEWKRAYAMGKSYIKARPDLARDGRPIFSGVAARGGTD